MTNSFLKLLKRRHSGGSSISPERTPAKRKTPAAAEPPCFGLPGQIGEDEVGAATPRKLARPRSRKVEAPLAVEDESMHLRWERVLAGRAASQLSPAELRKLGDAGMPLKHRHELWPQWFTAPCIADFEQEQARVPDDVAAQIDADVSRTQPQWMGLAEQRTLRRVLRAYAAGNPEVGYCQGMNNIAAVFILLGFDEVTALRGCYSLLNGCCPGYHSQDLAGYRLDAQVLGELARRVLTPKALARLQALGVPLEVLVSEHFLTLASKSWPLASTARLWDIILQEGSPALFASFLALLQLYLPGEADILLEAKLSCPGEEEPEPVDVFRRRALRGVTDDLETVLRQVREIIPKVPQSLVDQLRFDLTSKK